MNLLVGIHVGFQCLTHVVRCTTVCLLEKAEYLVPNVHDLLVEWIEGHHQKTSAFAAIAVVAPLLEERPHVCEVFGGLAF